MVEKVLSDGTCRRNAKRISEKLKSYGGASAAAQLIDDFVQEHGGTGSA